MVKYAENMLQSKIKSNLKTSELYEYALKEKNTCISSSGALVSYSGEKTGRSPSDKRIVKSDTNEKIWWGKNSPNIELSKEVFEINKETAIDYINSCDNIFVFDGFGGWDKNYRIKVRIVSTRAYHSLFMRNMLVRPTKKELASFGEPDYIIYNAGCFPANSKLKGHTSKTCIAFDLDNKEVVILGTEYAGEMKKGVFTIMHYLMPQKNILSLHSSANMSTDGDVSIFFGLSGTGKTTLSADPNRFLIGDDEHCWTDTGIFNIEGGCYAKCIGLSQKKEPEIFNAIKYGALLENVVLDDDRNVDFNDTTITQNTRVSYPIQYIPNSIIPCIGGHPKNIILLTCDAFGVLPPVSKLTKEQAMYYFISGYTAKVAGTEMGINEPVATFSSCFGSAFLVWHPIVYARLLATKMEQHDTNAWLVNTGWINGEYGRGTRCPLKYTRAIIDAIHDGSLVNEDYETLPIFKLNIPKKCNNVDMEILNPLNTKDDKISYLINLNMLAQRFIDNFKDYDNGDMNDVINAGPKI